MENKIVYVSNNPLFRSLTQAEVDEFKRWAHENYEANNGIAKAVWHPIVKQEFAAITEGRKLNNK